MMRDFISGALTLVISVVIIIPLLKIGFEKTGTSFFERPAFLLTIFGAIAVMAVIILVVAVRMNKAWFKASDEYSRLDRIFYYFLNMFSDYNTGKEIRVYNEQTRYRRSHNCIHIKTVAFITVFSNPDRIKYKRLVHNCAERACIRAGAAVYTFIVINLSGIFFAVCHRNSLYFARLFTRSCIV